MSLISVGRVLSDNVLFSRVPPPWLYAQSTVIPNLSLAASNFMSGICLADVPTTGPVFIAIDTQVTGLFAEPLAIVFCVVDGLGLNAFDPVTVDTIATVLTRIIWTKVVLAPGQAATGAVASYDLTVGALVGAYATQGTIAVPAAVALTTDIALPITATLVPNVTTSSQLVQPANSTVILSFEAPGILSGLASTNQVLVLAATESVNATIRMSAAILSPARPTYHGAASRGTPSY
jgi:hypothetical protein